MEVRVPVNNVAELIETSGTHETWQYSLSMPPTFLTIAHAIETRDTEGGGGNHAWLESPLHLVGRGDGGDKRRSR
jgi:hypothetical protein